MTISASNSLYYPDWNHLLSYKPVDIRECEGDYLQASVLDDGFNYVSAVSLRPQIVFTA